MFLLNVLKMFLLMYHVWCFMQHYVAIHLQKHLIHLETSALTLVAQLALVLQPIYGISGHLL